MVSRNRTFAHHMGLPLAEGLEMILRYLWWHLLCWITFITSKHPCFIMWSLTILGSWHKVNTLWKGRNRSNTTNQSLKCIHLLASSSLMLHSHHVASHDNISNTLSWGNITGFLTGYPTGGPLLPWTSLTTKPSSPSEFKVGFQPNLTTSEKFLLDPPECALHTMLWSLQTPCLIVCNYWICLFQASLAGLPGLRAGLPLDRSKRSSPSNNWQSSHPIPGVGCISTSLSDSTSYRSNLHKSISSTMLSMFQKRTICQCCLRCTPSQFGWLLILMSLVVTCGSLGSLSCFLFRQLGSIWL